MYSEHVQYVTSHPNSEAFTTQTLFSFITSSGDTAKPFSQTRPDSHPSNQKSNKTAHNFVNHHPPPTVTSRKEKAKVGGIQFKLTVCFFMLFKHFWVKYDQCKKVEKKENRTILLFYRFFFLSVLHMCVLTGNEGCH